MRMAWPTTPQGPAEHAWTQDVLETKEAEEEEEEAEVRNCRVAATQLVARNAAKRQTLASLVECEGGTVAAAAAAAAASDAGSQSVDGRAASLSDDAGAAVEPNPSPRPRAPPQGQFATSVQSLAAAHELPMRVHSELALDVARPPSH